MEHLVLYLPFSYEKQFHILSKEGPEVAQAEYKGHKCHNFNSFQVMSVFYMQPFHLLY